MKPIHLPIVLVALFAALTAACDLGTKQWAVAALAESPAAQRSAVCEHNPRTGGFTHHRRPAADVVVVRDALELHYAENCVAAFGILTSAPAPARRAVL